MLARTFASAVHGVNARTVTVEINSGGQVPKYFLLELPDSAVKEGEQRIESAIVNSGFRMPRLKLVINLAPADIRKEGAAYDLPLAMAILACSNQMLTDRVEDYIMMRELALDGGLRPIKGALPIAIQTRKEKFKGLIVPKENAREASIVNDLPVYGVTNLQEAIDVVEGRSLWLARVWDSGSPVLAALRNRTPAHLIGIQAPAPSGPPLRSAQIRDERDRLVGDLASTAAENHRMRTLLTEISEDRDRLAAELAGVVGRERRAVAAVAAERDRLAGDLAAATEQLRQASKKAATDGARLQQSYALSDNLTAEIAGARAERERMSGALALAEETARQRVAEHACSRPKSSQASKYAASWRHFEASSGQPGGRSSRRRG